MFSALFVLKEGFKENSTYDDVLIASIEQSNKSKTAVLYLTPFCLYMYQD